MNLPEYQPKRWALDILSSMPLCGIIVRESDLIERNAKDKGVEKEFSKLWEELSKIREVPSKIEDLIFQLIELIGQNQLLPDFQFHNAKGCMLLMKEISNRSKLGMAFEDETMINNEECLVIIKDTIDINNVEKEFELIVCELENADLIDKRTNASSPLGFMSIYPKKYFFCKTDKIFQNWDPEQDAKEIIKLYRNDKRDPISVDKLDTRIGWGPRRLNSALAYLDFKLLIKHDNDIIGPKYLFRWINLLPEAYLFIEK